MLNGTMEYIPQMVRDCNRLFSVRREHSQDFALSGFILGSKDDIHTILNKPEKEQSHNHEKVERSCILVIIEDKD